MRFLAVLAVLLAACADSGPYRPSEMTGAPHLVPSGALAMGLGYGEVRPLAVTLFDGEGRPSPDSVIRFRIFGDPGGSTLSTDRARTDFAGLATVELTAGGSEASFHVV